MCKGKELSVKTILVSQVDDKRIECNWDDISEAEQKVISRSISDRFMVAAGYKKADHKPDC